MENVEVVNPGAGERADASHPANTRLDLEEIYRAERGRLIRLATLLTQDRAAAEDVVHDAFAALRRRADRLAEPAKAPAYLRVAVVNGSRTFHRRRALTWRHLLVAQPEASEGADAPVLLAEEHRQVAAAVAKLPRRQRQVIALRYWSDMHDTEIAEALGVTDVTVRATASRALAALLKRLEDQ